MSFLTKAITLKYYKRKEIQEAILASAGNREIGIRFNQAFGKRPDILTYPRDILELALKGMTSLHSSEERWHNPLELSSELRKKDLDKLRSGWDLVLDIDCVVFEYSRICADLVYKFLSYCGVKEVSCKFSGNKGFHLAVPMEAFPKNIGENSIVSLFPEAPKKIAIYVSENIKEELAKRILAFENNNLASIRDKVNLSMDEIIEYHQNKMGDKIPKLKIDKFLEIDTVLISSRHLFRMPYSLHEKSGLVSLPIDPSKIMQFEKKMAHPDKVLMPIFGFLEKDIEKESARRLLTQALDFDVKLEEERKIKDEKKYEELVIESPIKEELFPPCIKKILLGMEDGKKRGIFCIMNFLGKIGWKKSEIEIFLQKWNQEKNPEPLREVYLKGQMAGFQAGKKLPPNCSNDAYYTGLDICNPDGLCKRIKNPVNYTIIKWKKYLQDEEERKFREQKEARKEELRLKREEKEKKQIEEFKKELEKKNNDKAI